MIQWGLRDPVGWGVVVDSGTTQGEKEDTRSRGIPLVTGTKDVE